MVKGRAKRPEMPNVQVRVRNIDKGVEELEQEQLKVKQRKEFLKNAMIEEQKMAHYNRMKMLTHWRKLLRLAKTEQLKKEIQIYQQNHDREVDAKDAILQMLDRDLDEAEEQFQMALRNHLIHVDDLIDLQESRLRGLKEEFERDVKIIKDEFDTEKREINESHQQERQELRDMIDTIKEEEDEKLREMNDNYQNLREEIKNKNIEDLDTMKFDLVKKIEELDQEFEVNFTRFMTDTEQKNDNYRKKLEDSDESTRKIGKYQRKIAICNKQTAFLTLKIAQQKKECEDRNGKLKQERDKIVKHMHELKRQMNMTREKEEKRLGDLTTNSKRCMDTLRDYERLGTKILKTAELCRKLETEKEKVLPFYVSDEVTNEEMNDPYIEKIEGIDKKKYQEFGLMDNFYKRFNKVLLDKLAIEKQKATLEKENMFFKSLLKQYLDGVSVNDDVINSNNPLLVVNSKVNLNRPPVEKMDGQPHKTFIEGNTVINNINLQRNANYN